MCQLGDALYVEIIVAAVTMSTADVIITKASKLIEQHFSAAAAFGFKTGNS